MLQGGGFNQLVRGPGVYFLYNRHDRYLGAEIAEYGHYSPDESAFLVSLIAPGNIVFDVGANIGSLTIPMARAAGRSGRLFAFEPQRLVFQVLCANIAINSLTNAECFMMCVGSQQGMLAIPELDPEVVNNFGGISAGAGRPVQCIPLDAFAGLPRIDLIKIDVEGMEREVVLGARTVIARHRPLLYVENDRKQNSASLIAELVSLGYDMFWHVPVTSPVAGQSIASVNMVCVPVERARQFPKLERVAGPNHRPAWDPSQL